MSTVACNICGWEGRYLVPEKGKEGFICSNCSSTSRNRRVVVQEKDVSGSPAQGMAKSQVIRNGESKIMRVLDDLDGRSP